MTSTILPNRRLAALQPALGIFVILTTTFSGATSMEAYPIKVTLAIQVESDRILVRTKFENRGSRTVLVKEGEYGYGFGDPDRTCAIAGAPKNPEFTVTTPQGDSIRYRGWLTRRAPPTKASFKPIAPGQVIDVRCTRLDNSYAFLPGTHDYKISHTHLEYDERTGETVVHQSGAAEFSYTIPWSIDVPR